MQEPAVLDDPQVQVGFCAAGEVAQDTAGPDAVGQRRVDAVVPARDRVIPGDRRLALDAHEPAMHADVFQQLLILARQAQLDACVWSERQQVCTGHEIQRVLAPHPILQLGERGDRHRNL